MNALFKKLKSYLEKNPKGRTELASHMNFTTAESIKRWIERKRIPVYHEKAVEAFLKKKEK